MKNVVILGAGRVAKPMVDYLLKFPDYRVILASRTVSKAEKLIHHHSHAEALPLDIQNETELDRLVERADLVVSLLPYTYHEKFARLCLTHQKPFITTSYLSEPIRQMDAKARERGVIILMEIGLDPGIDHMSAKKIIDQVHADGGKVVAFRSYCGGIPAPEANTNPLGYKFSWSPRGVLMAGRNGARFLENGKIVEIPGEDLFHHHWNIQIDGFELEVYTNRDSLTYIDLYQIPEVQTMFRGTLRYPGWSEVLGALSQLGLLSETKFEGVKQLPYAAILRQMLGIPESEDLKAAIARRLKRTIDDPLLKKLEWLGFFEETPFPDDSTTPIDFLTHLMLERMQYEPGERDLVVLFHDFRAEYPDRVERITSTLIEYGQPDGDTAMARTVSLPAAIAARLILEGKFQHPGVHIPVLPDLYVPVLEELEALGIHCREKREVLS
ncbi:MAG: saccharopine dehydrogenase [Calditrichaeota bacterium]|nr:saccharopine dehydrogenase [Calditrichota bacterium]